MNVRDRIVEFRRVPSAELRPNKKNWRTHPKAQADALRGVLADIGFAGACLARQLPDGTLELIDGHLRAETVTDQPIPVLILDVTEAEADKLLATYDPLGDMAGADAGKLDELLKGVQSSNEAVIGMLEGLAKDAGLEWACVDGGDAGESYANESMPTLFQVLVIFPDEKAQSAGLVELVEGGYECRSLIS